MLKLLKFANSLRGKFESASFDNATRESEKTQQQFLHNLLQKNAETQFGKAHRFAEINNAKDFQQQVPIRDYEGFRPFINKIIKGEQSVLTKEKPLMFTLTSGTTSEPKYIPVTRESQAYNAGLMRQWIYRAEKDHRALLSQASVGIVSRAVEGHTPTGIPFGSISGLIYKNIPWFVRQFYAVPYLVSELKDYDERYFVLARFALAKEVSIIATPNPTTLLRLAKICDEHQETLIRAIHDGKLGLKSSKQPEICAELAANLKPNPERAKQLSRIVAEKGFLHLADCWKGLQMIGCWLGGSVGIQAQQLAKVFGDVPLRDLGYMASEGHFTLPTKDFSAAGILAVRQNYFEFIPEAEADSEQPTVLLSHEVEIGKRYSILLTTAAGLYRYKLNDIIEIAGFHQSTPMISFIRKASEMTSITGEKLHVNHCLDAVNFVRKQFNLEIKQVRIVPNFNLCRYEILLELQQTFASEKLANKVLRAIDQALQSSNIEYEQKRSSKRLNAPCLHLMEIGWSNAGLRRHILAGKRDTQYKPPILCAEKCSEDAPFIVRTIEFQEAETPLKMAYAVSL